MLQHVDTMIGFSVVMLLMSLLVTVLVQGAVALLNLRGLNLLWGVTRLIAQVLASQQAKQGPVTAEQSAQIEKDARLLAKNVLEHPIVGHHSVFSWGRYATAIRPDELVRVLSYLADNGDTVAKKVAAAASDWSKVADQLPLTKDFEALFPEKTEQAKQVLAKVRERAAQDWAHVNQWFDAAMDRTSEQFVAYTRLITVVIAFAIAFGLHIDSYAIFRQISGDAELRARLVQSADATLKVAENVQAKQDESARLASSALKEAQKDLPNVALDAPIEEGLRLRAQGTAWIDAHVKDPAGKEAFTKAYDQHFQAAAAPLAKEMIASSFQISDQLKSTKLVLVPDPPPPWSRDHVLGLLATALFLGLGAPFWYNVLRQLANLRPLIAGKVEKDDASGGA